MLQEKRKTNGAATVYFNEGNSLSVCQGNDQEGRVSFDAEAQKDPDTKDPDTKNSKINCRYSKIDLGARVIFPVSFAVLLAGYVFYTNK